MTNEQAKKMLKAKLECLKRETSGTDIDCNCRNCDECSLNYEQGNMGEQKEALDTAIKLLEQQQDKVIHNHPLVDAYVNKVLDEIKSEISVYEADCRLTNDLTSDECNLCNDTIFSSIYHIIDKYKNGGDSE